MPSNQSAKPDCASNASLVARFSRPRLICQTPSPANCTTSSIPTTSGSHRGIDFFGATFTLYFATARIKGRHETCCTDLACCYRRQSGIRAVLPHEGRKRVTAHAQSIEDSRSPVRCADPVSSAVVPAGLDLALATRQLSKGVTDPLIPTPLATASRRIRTDRSRPHRRNASTRRQLRRQNASRP